MKPIKKNARKTTKHAPVSTYGKLRAISIEREMVAGQYGMNRNTTVFFIRDNDATDSHFTNDVLERGNISEASVIRAKRAQVALMERFNRNAE